MTQTKQKESSFLMVKLPDALKTDLQRVLVEEKATGGQHLDMSKATRQALEDWIAKTRKAQERRVAKASTNGS